jgi:hypothetical protein
LKFKLLITPGKFVVDFALDRDVYLFVFACLAVSIFPSYIGKDVEAEIGLHRAKATIQQPVLSKGEIAKLLKEEIARQSQQETAKLVKEEVAKLLREEIAKLRQKEIAKLPQEEIAKHLKEKLIRLPQEEVAKLLKDAIANLPHEEVSKLLREEIANLPLETVAKLLKKEIAKVPRDEITKLLKEALKDGGAKVPENRIALIPLPPARPLIPGVYYELVRVQGDEVPDEDTIVINGGEYVLVVKDCVPNVDMPLQCYMPEKDRPKFPLRRE